MPTILILDDDNFFLNSASFFLKSEGYEVETSNDGKAGLTMFQTKTFDAVLCSTQLNHKSGFEIVTSIKSIAKNVPIILISPANNILRMSLSDDLVYDAYLQKPINFKSLKEAVQKVLHQEFA